MDKLVGIFDGFWSASRPLPVVLFFFGTVLLTISDKVEQSFQKIVSGSGIFLVALSLCFLLIRIWERQDPNIVVSSQILDGFLMGLLSGITAGFVGYGMHTDGVLETVVIRTITVTVYSTSIGGLLGIVFVLIQPENRSIVRSNYSMSALVAIALLSVTLHISFDRMPVVDEGIIGWEVYIIFATFTTFMLVKRAASRRYHWPLIFSRLSLSLGLQILAWVVLLLAPAPNPFPDYPEFQKSLWTVEIYEGLRGGITFGILIVTGIAIQIMIYLSALSDVSWIKEFDQIFARKILRKSDLD